MRAVLIDDEYYALQGLQMVLDEIDGIEVVGMYEEGLSALTGVEALNPDLIFLDIEMPGLNGMELFKQILEIQKTPNIVFVTAYNHYAVQAFELNALDYVVKPVQKARLMKTLERLQPLMGQTGGGKKITLNCFGSLSILADGQEINIGWRTKKAEELVAYLLCQNGHFISKEKIAAALWPDLDGEKSVSNLYLAYYYLKKQEKNYGVLLPIESIRGKMRIRMEEVDSDVMRFESCQQSCHHIDDENIALAEKAVELYQGMLLEDRYYSWATEAQQHYELVYLELLKKIVDYFKQKGEREKQQLYTKKKF